MKKLVLLLTLASTSAFASSDTRDKVNASKAAFAQLSAVEAFYSNKFDKQVPNIGLTGTSTWVKATSLCVDGDMMRTKVPANRQVCVEWTYRNSEGDRKVTTSVGTATRFDARCSKKASGVALEAPINFTTEVTIWGARKDGELLKAAGGKARVFRNKSDADDAGSPVALGTKTVANSLPTTYSVKFFRRSANNDNKFSNRYFVGSHKYSVAQCN